MLQQQKPIIGLLRRWVKRQDLRCRASEPITDLHRRPCEQRPTAVSMATVLRAMSCHDFQDADESDGLSCACHGLVAIIRLQVRNIHISTCPPSQHATAMCAGFYVTHRDRIGIQFYSTHKLASFSNRHASSPDTGMCMWQVTHVYGCFTDCSRSHDWYGHGGTTTSLSRSQHRVTLKANGKYAQSHFNEGDFSCDYTTCTKYSKLASIQLLSCMLACGLQESEK